MPEDMYRHGASVLLIRKTQQGHELLLLKKPRKNDAWQLPQGGVEQGETVEQAAMRELHEEAGIADAEVLGKSERVYCYDFPSAYRKFRPDNVCGQKIEFVLALADENAHVKVDNHEIEAHVWIPLVDLPRFVDRKEYRELVENLFGEAIKNLG